MTDGSGNNHMEYDYSNADRLGDDAWIVCGFFYGRKKRNEKSQQPPKHGNR